MKILVTHEIFPPEIYGGGEKLTLKLIELLMEKGHEVKVLTSGDPKIKDYNGIPTIRLPVPGRYLMNLPVNKYVKYSKDVDVIQTSSGNTCFPSWLAAKINKKPICCLVHHILGPYWLDVRGPLLGRVFQKVEKIFLTRSYDAIVFQNKNSKKLGFDMGVDKKRIREIRPGVFFDLKEFQSKKSEKKPFVLFVGNFSMVHHEVKYKGLDYLLEAAKKLSDVRFVIVGGGSYLDILKKTASKNVDFFGPANKDQLIRLYNEALISCQPSVTEGFGLAIQEAMAGGCAIVSTVDIGEEGMLIEPKNTDQIVNGIRYLMNNPDVARKMGEKNREIVKEFTWEKFVNGYLNVYESIIQK